MWVTPKAGLKMRDYRTRRPLAAGEAFEVPDADLTFARLVMDGDLVEVSAPAPEPVAAKPPAPAIAAPVAEAR